MRKTLNINLGGRAFIIDENAYEALHHYLETLRQKFNNEAERDEILNDIEARIGEMLNQKLANYKEVVSMAEVQEVIAAMGQPEDIAGEEPGADHSGSSSQAAQAVTAGPVQKKLFRDADDAKVAGVISGMCHYFGIADPVWMRIAALVLIPLTSGSIIILYLLIMIIVPKALTSAEKLQMKGEPININTIEKEIKDAAVRTSESVNRFLKEETFFEKAGGIVIAVVTTVAKILLLLGVVVSVIALVAVCIGFVTFFVLGKSQFNPVTGLLIDNAKTLTYFSWGFLLFLGVPLLAAIYNGLRVFVGNSVRVKWLKWVFLTAWFLGLLLLLLSGYKTLVNFRQDGIKKEQLVLMPPANGTLLVQLADSTGKPINAEEEKGIESFYVNEEGVFVNGVNVSEMDRIPVAKPSLEIMPSESDSFYIQEIITASGRNLPEANRHAANVLYRLNQTDTVINLDPRLYIGKNQKWRAQKIKLRIAIPEGKKLSFGNNIDLWAAVVKGDKRFDDTYFANTTWTVVNGKVKCIAGENHFNAEKDGELIQEDIVEENGKQIKKQIRVIKEKEESTHQQDY